MGFGLEARGEDFLKCSSCCLVSLSHSLLTPIALFWLSMAGLPPLDTEVATLSVRHRVRLR